MWARLFQATAITIALSLIAGGQFNPAQTLYAALDRQTILESQILFRMTGQPDANRSGR